jgi:thiamine-monophosphate kinase
MRLTEDRLIRLFRQRFDRGAADLVRGMGDDAAVIHPRNAAEDWVITTDMLLEDVDFRRSWLTPVQLGHKSLAVNLSDIAAMGARPRFYTVALAVPPDITESWVLRFYDGISGLADAHHATLIGGDLSRSGGGIEICITAIGEALQGNLVYRSGGKAGDEIFVTGVLGRAAAGLELLLAGRARRPNGSRRAALAAQRTPTPRCDAGLWLARSGLVGAMMDLSDGLSVDLPRLCSASGTGAEVRIWDLPVFPESRSWNCDPLRLALHGGEDFELLFSVRAEHVATLLASYPTTFPPITAIGTLTAAAGVLRRERPTARPLRLSAEGFDHFRP